MIVDRLLFLWVEKGTQCEAADDIQCGATESEQTSVAPITAPFWGWVSKRMRKWEDSFFFFFRTECAVIWLPDFPHPCSIRMRPWKLFCLSCGKFVQIKAFKADVCYLYNRQRQASLSVVGLLAFFFFFFLHPWIVLTVEYQIIVPWWRVIFKVAQHFHFHAVQCRANMDTGAHPAQRHSTEHSEAYRYSQNHQQRLRILKKAMVENQFCKHLYRNIMHK